jgi:hypothetical protein
VIRKSKAPTKAPTTEGTIYFDANGKRCTVQEHTKIKPVSMTVREAGEYLSKLEQWMR